MAPLLYGLLTLCVLKSVVSAKFIHTVNGSCFQLEDSYHVFDMHCFFCDVNLFLDCPDGTEKLTNGTGIAGCTYEESLGPGHNVTKEGCHHTCRQEVNITSCCHGYWGQYCDQCPGSSDLPCNGHGNCSDGRNGTGQCSCSELWTGYSCELCTNSSLLYPNCTTVQSVECNMTCPNNSHCLEIAGEPTCTCEWPYVDHSQDEEQLHCKEVDFCSLPPVCHINANCTQNIEKGEKNCTCDPGFHGDGYDCGPINPCQTDNGGCDLNSTDCVFLSPGKSKCLCKYGYFEYVPNYGCSLIDICNKTVCHSKAICETTEPFTVSCTCPEGYVGNGINCTGNILQTMKDLNTDDPDMKGQLNLIKTAMETFYKKELTESSPITVFVPIDAGFKTIGAVNFQKWLSDEYKVKALLRQHILVGDYMLEYLRNQSMFYTLDGVGGTVILTNVRRNLLNFRISGSNRQARILKADIVASNGIIHVTKKLLVDSLGEIGNTQITADRYIGSLHAYSTFNLLIERMGSPVKTLLQKPGVTVFAPPNEAWDKLPWDSLDYLLKPENKGIVETILKNHILNETYEVADFFNIRRLVSAAGFGISIAVDNGRFRINEDIHITNADIVVENGLLMKTDAVIVPVGISTLPNFCLNITYDVVVGPCGDCREEQKCFTPDTKLNETIVCEFYAKNDEGQYEKVGGCAPMCNRSFTTSTCCAGFYGYDCLPCPGGYRNPCNGHGQCDPRTGECKCNPNFSGLDCSDCENKNHFGPNCSQECTCIKGTCKNGPEGDGTCRSCFYNFLFGLKTTAMATGENCDKWNRNCGQRGKDSIHCHVHAWCVKIDSHTRKCICDDGYTGDGENYCTEIDPCQTPDYGGCHQQATCEKTGPGMNNCTCNPGWTGDGTFCYRASTCRNHSNCHENAICIETYPGSHICRCHAGYHGDGITWCVLEDMCSVDNGGCHPKANCTNREPGRVNCTCLIDKGYSGNGYTCTGNIIKTIMDNKNLSWISEVLSRLNQYDRELLLDNNYTVFIPHDQAVDSFISTHSHNETFGHWRKKDVLLTLLNYHTFLDGTSLDKLVALSQFEKIETMEDGYYLQLKKLKNGTVVIYPMADGPTARVLESDIIATNGYVNIIDQILLPFLPASPDDYPDLETFFKLHPKYSVFGDWLMKKNLTLRIEDDFQEYTLFVPTNSAMKHLKQTVTTDYLLYHVVSKKVMMATAGNQTLITALGTRHQLDLMVYGWYNVTVNRVAIVESDVFTFGGLVNGIEGLLHPVLHKCQEVNQKVKYGPCSVCGEKYTCYPGFEPYLVNNGSIVSCKYTSSGYQYLSRNFELDGCQGLCYKNKTKNGCCSGYYGQTCVECPGGPESPCSGHGQCDDGIRGNGQCVCDQGFTGYSCGQCMHGWTGEHCETDMNSCAYHNGGCDINAGCTMLDDRTITCHCPEGFKGDGYNCTGPCDRENGGCHGRATCKFEESTGIQCTCKLPFVGDGKTSCNADIFSTLLSMDKVSGFIKSTKQLAGDTLIGELKNSSFNGKFILFVPVDKGLTHPIAQRKEYLQQIVRNNSTLMLRHDHVTRQQLLTMAGNPLIVTFNSQQNLFYINKTYVIQGNILCTNGIIHLVAEPFTPVTVEKSQQSRTSLGTTLGISLPVMVLFIALIVGGVILWKRKSQSNYWTVLQEWRSKQRSESVSQEEPLQEKEEGEEDVTQSDTKFGNPLYLVQNLD